MEGVLEYDSNLDVTNCNDLDPCVGEYGQYGVWAGRDFRVWIQCVADGNLRL